MCEEWRAVVGFEGLYEVSSYGRVKRCARVATQRCGMKYPVRERLLKLFEHTGGYRQVCLRSELGKNGKMHYVHRLVAQAFLPNPEKLHYVNHIDLDKTRNCVTNLEWCHAPRNQQHAAREGRFHGRTNPKFRRKLTPEQADAIRTMDGSSSEIATLFGVSSSMVLHIKNGRRWLHPEQEHYEFA